MSIPTSGIPFTLQNLHEGKRYIKIDTTLYPFSPSSSPGPHTIGSPIEGGEEIRVLSKQMGGLVLEHDSSYVTKSGSRVRRAEERAMRLVAKHTAVLLPEVIYAHFSSDRGEIGMTIVPGSPLERSWKELDDKTKERVCHETWDLITKMREIPRPPELKDLFQCAADGAPTTDKLIEDLDEPPKPLLTDDDVRGRIYKRYLRYAGRRYEKELPDMLPRSSRSVFTHADIAPRNIMVDEGHHITGILDWELAGWYPDYWEYAQVMRPACRLGDWQKWMDHTAPQKWDISSINAARRVLF